MIQNKTIIKGLSDEFELNVAVFSLKNVAVGCNIQLKLSFFKEFLQLIISKQF